jgi:hypothetical protein
MFNSISSCTIWIVDLFSSHLCFSIVVNRINRSVYILAILDSGAIAVFINERFVKQYNILYCPLIRPIAVETGSHKHKGAVEEVNEVVLSGLKHKHSSWLLFRD